ncbi:GNAT family N-acetyltransferase [Umezawaea endophytica]|uniref:GNAT family N-acetyltransferase n=1 Tax=Umezawaea endophytica TaxID=1654476 RepID=A0A9X2VXI7_9PSEU|nr:GNAT family N-acetyltransferase [Umezawaea endophytica]MCS7484520.1 GNAT family N-acetyltransferase [Umezawaea endophytica]
MVVLRELEVDDWADWRELRLAALRDAPEAFGAKLAEWQGAGDTERRWRDRLDGVHNVLAYLDGEPAGMVSGMPNGHGVELISMWVAPFARGRGVGDALVDAVVDRADGTVSLAVKESNHAAAALYRRHGFVDDGPSGDGERRLVRHPTGSWLTPKAEVRDSPIEGLGLFATEPIAAGEVVLRLGGRLIDDTDLAALTPPYSSLTVGVACHLLLDPAHPVRYGNHSCDPTLWHVDATTVVARTRVRVGTELTLDYATHTGVESWRMPCRCGSSACRGSVSGADWRLPDLRHAYGDHWSPPLLDRIRS